MFINRYNWLGQKLLAQQQHAELCRLLEFHSNSRRRHKLPDELLYLSSLAKIKLCEDDRPKFKKILSEILLDLQSLDGLEQNIRQFLLLCQTLLMLGNSEAVVAICKQQLWRELNHPETFGVENFESTGGEVEMDTDSPKLLKPTRPSKDIELEQLVGAASGQTRGTAGKQLVSDARLWMMFGLALMYQRQLRDAHAALQMAARLSNGIKLTNFHLASLEYARFCFRFHCHLKQAQRVLDETSRLSSHWAPAGASFPLAARLAIALGHHDRHLGTALNLLGSLESHSNSIRNPALAYNKLSWLCHSRLQQAGRQPVTTDNSRWPSERVEPSEARLDFQLARCHLVLRNLHQELAKLPPGQVQTQVTNQTSRLVDAMRGSHPLCWTSSHLWNNLAVCQLARSKSVAALACLLKANLMQPLDWRANCNLALVSLQLGQLNRALACLWAAQLALLSYRKRETRSSEQAMLSSLLAICYDKLGQQEEARRLHMLASNSSRKPPALALLNYLLFLQRNPGEHDDAHELNKLKLHLLDQLEQSWLTRSQTDYQFEPRVLERARYLGDLVQLELEPSIRKSYAWNKLQAND